MDSNSVTTMTEEYEAPMAVRAGSLVELAAGTYSEGESDDGDYGTVKWNPKGTVVNA
ncbi:hypothetical protein ACWGIB_21200 [Streptomyces xiamenensis]